MMVGGSVADECTEGTSQTGAAESFLRKGEYALLPQKGPQRRLFGGYVGIALRADFARDHGDAKVVDERVEADVFDETSPIHSRHRLVGQDDVEELALELGQSFIAACGNVAVVDANLTQHFWEQYALHIVIIDNEDMNQVKGGGHSKFSVT